MKTAFIFGALVLLALVAMGLLAGRRSSARDLPVAPTMPALRSDASPDERFWMLVDATTVYESDPEAQVSALRSFLSQLPAEQVLEFERTFDRMMRESYSWDLWCAAYVVHGGSSDDGFEYFRCWLISQGRRVFEKVKADPDSLADLVADDPGGPLEFEEFAYVAREVWGEKTGKDAGEIPGAANMIYPDLDPKGEPFSEEPASLAKRYPKLWNRFGNDPLG